ncbi:MAG TPA: hypothetical protein VFL41_09365 [Gaiellaceae bacterium]|nr:hypothetical protein [Gaiellaceae bacterium]
MILAAGLVAAALVTAAPARADNVALRTDETSSDFLDRGAVGRLVPGRGPTFSREEALDALEDVLGTSCPCRYTIYLTLPRWGERPYNGLYRIAISGPGYPPGTMLVSDRTRIPGLVSIYDVEPTIEALEKGEKPPLTAQRVGDVGARLEALETRLDEAHRTRTAAALVVAAAVALFTAYAVMRRSVFFGRAALLAIPAGLAAALALSAMEASTPRTAVLGVALAAAVGGPLLAAVTADRRAFAVALLTIFPIYLVVLSISTETSSLAALGARPENGGRFYGFQNQLETMLLVPALLGAALAGLTLYVPVALLALVTVGASFAGADGGGLLVFTTGFLFLWLRLRRVPLTARNLALAGAGVVVIGVALVGLDAALGGSSHVTRSLSGGPFEVLGDLAHRVRLTLGGLVSSFHAALIVAVSLPTLVWLALRKPRYAVLDALLVALAVSLLVNDSPRDIAGWGALSAVALRFWCEAASPVE